MSPTPNFRNTSPQAGDAAAAQSLFRGLWIPLVTPFDLDGQVDHAALRNLVSRLAQQGVHGFVACGSTGEAAALDSAEQLAVLETVLACSGACPVVMGLSGYNLPETIAWIRTICERPVAGLLVPAPHYIRPSQDGLRQWFETLADASDAPVVIYDIPYRTGVSLSIDTLLVLAEHPRIAAIKDCAGDIVKTLTLIAQAHWHALVPLVHLLFAEPNPGPLKAVLAGQGDMHGGLRAPMQGASSPMRTALQHAMAAVIRSSS